MINTTKIARSNLKQNKSKSILIIITIVLSTILLASVFMTCVDWNEANKERTRLYCGSQHGLLGGITQAKYNEVKAHADIESIGVVNGVGLKEYEDESKIALSYMDKNAVDFNSMNLIDGKLPSKKNEIVLDDLALDRLGYENKIGQKIKIQYGDYSKKGITDAEFILTGITTSSESSKTRRIYNAIVSEEYMKSTRDMNKENFNVYIKLKNTENLQGQEIIDKVNKVARDLDIPNYRVLANEDYIKSLKPDQEVITWGVLIGIVIILSSILVIYNIFYLSIVTKVQEFGKLRAIGATKKQIKSIVLKEGIFLSLIAIPLGTVIGYIINKLVINKIFFEGTNISKLPIAIFVMLISFATVFVSLLKPMKVASKVSIIDAVRYNGEEKSNKKSRKGYESINIKRLSHANLSRNKKRTYITLISLSLSGILFIVVSSVLSSMDAEKLARDHFPYDLRISLDSYTFGDEDSPETELNILQTKNPLGLEFRDEISKMNGVKNIEIFKETKAELPEYNTEYKYHDFSSIDESDLEGLEFYLQSGKIDLEKLKLGKEIILLSPELAKEINIKVGDKITITLYDGNEKLDKEFKVQAITSAPGTFAVHNDAFNKLLKNDTTTSIGIYTEKDKYIDVKNYIESLDKKDEYLQSASIDKELEVANLSINSTKIMAYSLVVIIGIIGFMNLINSMITSIITRKKELGMLQAIGLTNKQLIKMLNIEAMFYTLTMLASSLTLGTGLGYIAVYAFRKTGASYASYEIPLIQIIIMIVFSIVSQLLLTYLISKNFNKESLIDRVRYNE